MLTSGKMLQEYRLCTVKRTSHEEGLPPLSMFEVTDAGENHRQSVSVGGGDYLVVSNGTARLDHRGDSMLRSLVDSVAKRKERIRCQHRAGHRQQRTHRTDLHRIN